jgi:carnitine O-acetyltransferase
MSTSSRRSDWKALAPLSHPGPTFAAQPSLPKLSVPELQQSLARLKQSLRPIAWSDAEYDAVASKIDRFANGLGPRLQERLLQRRAQTDHWLEEWWDRDAYLSYRDSVVVNVSYYCTLLITCGVEPGAFDLF